MSPLGPDMSALCPSDPPGSGDALIRPALLERFAPGRKPNRAQPEYQTKGNTLRKSSQILGAIAVGTLVAASGSAFTASNTLSGDNVVGYGTSTVTGATVEAIEHTLNATGTAIASTALTFTTDLGAGHQVKSGFGSTALESCVVTVNVSPAKDTAVCTYSATYTTTDAATFNVAVS